MSDKKGKRTRLSIQQKLEALRMLEGGCRNMAVMTKFDIAERTVVKLKKEGPKIIQEAERNSLTLNTKTVRQPRYPLIDEQVLQLVHLARSVKFNFTVDMITRRALLVKDLLLENSNLKNAQRNHLKSFSASKGWTINFIRRYGLRTIPSQGDVNNGGGGGGGGGVKTTMTRELVMNLQKRLDPYDAKYIYSIDETALYFKVMPTLNYVESQGNSSLSLNEKLSLGTKDRITAYTCCNADGSERVPLFIIGMPKHPPCFKTGHIPNGMTYFSNETACSNADTFRAWFKNSFVPFIQTRTSEKVVLLVDLPNSYGTVKDEKGQIQVIEFNQPPELDINVMWKREYRKRLLRAMLIDIEAREELRKVNIANAPGINGIAEGFLPHLLDGMRISKSAWESISQSKIARCWQSANILPPRINAQVDRVIDGSCNNMESDLNVFMKMHKKLVEHLKHDDPMFSCELGDEHVERWLNMECSTEVSSALIQNSMNDKKPLSVEIESDTNQVVEGVHNTSDVETVAVEMPTLEALDEAFRPAQKLIYSCHIPDASNHLNRALDMIRAAISKRKEATKAAEKKVENKSKEQLKDEKMELG